MTLIFIVQSILKTFLNMLEKKSCPAPKKIMTVEEQIRDIARAEGVDPDLAVAIAKCESSLNSKAVLVNDTGTRDRGLFQINNYYHPEVTDEQAFDIAFSTRFFCKAYKEGNISWWNASRKCWGLTKK